MKSFLTFDTVKSGWSIIYIDRFQAFLSLNNNFVLANSADPVERPHYAKVPV